MSTHSPAESKLQFRLWHVFVAVSLICSFLAFTRMFLSDGESLWLASFAGSITYIFWGKCTGRWGWATLPAIIAVFLAFSLLSVLRVPGQQSRRLSCTSNLKHIALAIHFYHDEYKSLPPAYIADSNGKPIHSWRVLLLPYLERKDLYDRYDFSEPWDGPKNILLAPEITRIYQCPESGKRGDTAANYFAVVGPGTFWPGTTSVSLDDAKDGSATTILVVESHNAGIQGSEPLDLDLATMAAQINSTGGKGVSSLHGTGYYAQAAGAQVVFADGQIQYFPNAMTAQQLRSRLLIADEANAAKTKARSK